MAAVEPIIQLNRFAARAVFFEPRKTRPSAHTDTLAFQKQKSLPAHVDVRTRRSRLPIIPQRRRRAADVVGQSHAKVRLRDEARHEEVVRRVVRREGELPSQGRREEGVVAGGVERDAELERDPAYLAARSRELLNGIVDGSSVDLDAEVLAAFALDASGDDALLPSTLRRELAFAAHHATHHFFVAGLVAKSHLGLALPDDVGRAPATLRHDRQASSTGAYVDVGG